MMIILCQWDFNKINGKIALVSDQFDAQIFNTFITILYMYMFRAISCSSSGGQIVLMQHLVSSLSVSDSPVHRLREKERKKKERKEERKKERKKKETKKERFFFSTCAPDGPLLTLTIPDAVLIQFDLLRMSKILLETCTCRGL
jgi:hypothetical protein